MVRQLIDLSENVCVVTWILARMNYSSWVNAPHTKKKERIDNHNGSQRTNSEIRNRDAGH